MVQDYKDGGCRMVDVHSFVKSIKLTISRRLFQENCDWSVLFISTFRANSKYIYVISCQENVTFIINVHKAPYLELTHISQRR